jgi:hypothetical protein
MKSIVSLEMPMEFVGSAVPVLLIVQVCQEISGIRKYRISNFNINILLTKGNP